MDYIFPQGHCPQHGPLLSVNGVPRCVRCDANEANKGRVALVNTLPDPGEGINSVGAVVGPVSSAVAVMQKQAVKATSTSISYESGLQDILSILAGIPMPSSMKRYKLLMSVKQKIETALLED